MGIYKVGNVWYIDYYCEGRRIREAVGEKKMDAKDVLVSGASANETQAAKKKGVPFCSILSSSQAGFWHSSRLPPG